MVGVGREGDGDMLMVSFHGFGRQQLFGGDLLSLGERGRGGGTHFGVSARGQ